MFCVYVSTFNVLFRKVDAMSPPRVLNFVTPEFYTPLFLEGIARDARYQKAQ